MHAAEMLALFTVPCLAAKLLESDAVILRAVETRHPFIDPLNLIQIDVLKRVRAFEDAKERAAAEAAVSKRERSVTVDVAFFCLLVTHGVDTRCLQPARPRPASRCTNRRRSRWLTTRCSSGERSAPGRCAFSTCCRL